ncbi:Ribosome production factor 1 [Bienertia sinuspersici]
MGFKRKKRDNEELNDGGAEDAKPSTSIMKREQILPSMIKNKEKRSEIHSKLKHEKKLEKRKKLKARAAADKRALELGEELPPRQVPRTIENTREADETVCKPDDEELFAELDTDEFSGVLKGNCVPKVLITTCRFNSSNHGNPTSHWPELVLNNFTTRLGCRVGRMIQSLFPQNPEFRGRRVVTFHNQRDYIFFRHHRYVFETKETKSTDSKTKGKESTAEKKISDKLKARLQECGPRFVLKLISLQHGTFDPRGGEFEWNHKPEMDTSRRRFSCDLPLGFLSQNFGPWGNCKVSSFLSLNIIFLIIAFLYKCCFVSEQKFY